jgi:hypothetical protein
MTMSVVTPSYRPDLDLCRILHESLQRFGPTGVAHHIVVPKKDRALFAGIGDVCSADEFLPGSFRALPGNMWLNLRRPIPPVRGWIAQQLIKLAAVVASTADVVLLVDSDMIFVRRFAETTFYRDNEARFYRSPDAIDERLPRHVLWHKVARRLLGLRPVIRLPLPDYISWPMSWDPKVVRAMLDRVEQVAGAPWPTAIGSELHFSEGILYGVYVDEVLGGSAFTEETMLSVAYSDKTPLDANTVKTFVAALSSSDIAAMISAKSGRDLAARAEFRKLVDAALSAAGTVSQSVGPKTG